MNTRKVIHRARRAAVFDRRRDGCRPLRLADEFLPRLPGPAQDFECRFPFVHLHQPPCAPPTLPKPLRLGLSTGSAGGTCRTPREDVGGNSHPAMRRLVGLPVCGEPDGARHGGVKFDRVVQDIRASPAPGRRLAIAVEQEWDSEGGCVSRVCQRRSSRVVLMDLRWSP